MPERCAPPSWETIKIDRIDYRGSQARVIYRTECEGVGPVVMKTHQEPPLVVSKEDAAPMKPGMRVVLLVSADGRDVAVERLEWPGKKGVVVLRGIALDVP